MALPNRIFPLKQTIHHMTNFLFQSQTATVDKNVDTLPHLLTNVELKEMDSCNMKPVVIMWMEFQLQFV